MFSLALEIRRHLSFATILIQVQLILKKNRLKLKKSLLASIFFFFPSQTAFLHGMPNLDSNWWFFKIDGYKKKPWTKDRFWIDFRGLRAPSIYPTYSHHKHPIEYSCISTLVSHIYQLSYPQKYPPYPPISISMCISVYTFVSQIYIYTIFPVMTTINIQLSIHVYPCISHISIS